MARGYHGRLSVDSLLSADARCEQLALSFEFQRGDVILSLQRGNHRLRRVHLVAADALICVHPLLFLAALGGGRCIQSLRDVEMLLRQDQVLFHDLVADNE